MHIVTEPHYQNLGIYLQNLCHPHIPHYHITQLGLMLYLSVIVCESLKPKGC